MKFAGLLRVLLLILLSVSMCDELARAVHIMQLRILFLFPYEVLLGSDISLNGLLEDQILA